MIEVEGHKHKLSYNGVSAAGKYRFVCWGCETSASVNKKWLDERLLGKPYVKGSRVSSRINNAHERGYILVPIFVNAS